MPSALITGGAGFIGSFVVDALLNAGSNVVVLDNFSAGNDENLAQARTNAKSGGLELSVIKADLSQVATWEQIPACESIFHIAAQTSVTASVADPAFDFTSNVLGIPHFCRYIQRAKTRRFLYANTAGALYGETKIIPTPEDHPIRPLSPYGATKSFTETYFRAWSHSLRAQGSFSATPSDPNYFSWASLRLGNIYGPRQVTKGEAGVVPIFFEKLLSAEPAIIFGDGSKTRDYVHVEDVAQAFIAAWAKLDQAPLDEAYNVSAGIETRDIEVYQAVYSALKSQAPELLGPESREPVFKAVRAGEILKSRLDVSKIKRELNWVARIAFNDGIQSTVKTYLAHHARLAKTKAVR